LFSIEQDDDDVVVWSRMTCDAKKSHPAEHRADQNRPIGDAGRSRPKDPLVSRACARITASPGPPSV